MSLVFHEISPDGVTGITFYTENGYIRVRADDLRRGTTIFLNIFDVDSFISSVESLGAARKQRVKIIGQTSACAECKGTGEVIGLFAGYRVPCPKGCKKVK